MGVSDAPARPGRTRGVALLAALLVVACHSRVEAPASREPFEDLVVRVERARGLRANRPIDARVVSSSELAELLAAALVADRTPEELDRYEEGLVSVGLWPADRRLVDAFLQLLGEEVAGLYLSDQRALFVVSESGLSFRAWLAAALARHDLMAEYTLTHELVHLLQHQHHPELIESDPVFFHHDDLALAVQAAFEGDALYYGALAMDGPLPTPELFDLSVGDPAGGTEGGLAGAPRLLQELMNFPYTRGYRLALAEGAALLDDPPASSEQVIHPDRRHADFAVFDLGVLASRLPEGCRPVFENSVGELQMRILLQEAASGEPLPALWEGWDGDRYLAVRCGERRALLWLTTWDSPRDAEEFASGYAALAERLAARAGLTAPLRVERSGRDVGIASAELGALLPGALAEVPRQRVASVAALRAFARRSLEAPPPPSP